MPGELLSAGEADAAHLLLDHVLDVADSAGPEAHAVVRLIAISCY